MWVSSSLSNVVFPLLEMASGVILGVITFRLLFSQTALAQKKWALWLACIISAVLVWPVSSITLLRPLQLLNPSILRGVGVALGVVFLVLALWVLFLGKSGGLRRRKGLAVLAFLAVVSIFVEAGLLRSAVDATYGAILVGNIFYLSVGGIFYGLQTLVVFLVANTFMKLYLKNHAQQISADQ
jgi:hypothetical protein